MLVLYVYLLCVVENPNLWEFEKEDIEQLVELYFDLHLFYVNLNVRATIFILKYFSSTFFLWIEPSGDKEDD